MRPTQHAAHRLMSVPLSRWDRPLDPVTAADRRTSLADARAALCLAGGVAVDDIDPSSGHNLSRAAYERARQSWQVHWRDEGGCWSERTVAKYREARGSWAARRPEWADEWLVAARCPVGRCEHLEPYAPEPEPGAPEDAGDDDSADDRLVAHAVEVHGVPEAEAWPLVAHHWTPVYGAGGAS